MMHDLRSVAVIRVPLLHLPAGPFLIAGVGLVAAALVTARGTGRAVRPMTRAGTFGLIVAPDVLTLGLAPVAPAKAAALAILAMCCIVILWEFVGGMLLAVPRFQGPLLAFCWMMHATLSFIGFVHFGALAFAMLFTFLRAQYLDLMTRRVRLILVNRAAPRVYVCFAIAALAGIVSGLNERLSAAILFNLATDRGQFHDVQQPAHRGALQPPAARRQPGQDLDYQEAVIHFTAIDTRLSGPSYEGQSLDGQELPVVEFRKWICRWTEAGAVVPMTFTYRGHVYRTPNIVTDPVWRTPARTWAMRLMDFRIIQPEGPNRGRW